MPTLTHHASTSPAAVASLGRLLGADAVVSQSGPTTIVTVPPDRLLEAVELLASRDGGRFDDLHSLAGVDWKPEIGVAYHLFSHERREWAVLHVRLNRDSPRVPSLTGLFGVANWHEREAFDLLGIEFVGHPALTRILTPHDWVGHPLRKDYREPESWRGLPVPYPEDEEQRAP